MITAKEAIDEVLGLGVTELFKSRAFRKQGHRFLKWEGELCQSAHFYSSQYSIRGNVMFTIEAGVFVKYVEEITSGRAFPKSLLDATPLFSCRLGRCMEKPLPDLLAEFWTVRSTEDIVPVAEQVRTRCAEQVLPFLENLGDEVAIVSKLHDTLMDSSYIPALGRIAVIQAQRGLLPGAQRTLGELTERFSQSSASMREVDRNVVHEYLSRIRDFVQSQVERGASNGGPTTPFGNSGAVEGPPPVS